MVIASTGLGEPVSAATNAVVLAPGRVVEAAGQDLQAHGTVPSDGRLRGPDYTATVTRVAWPTWVIGTGDFSTPERIVASSGHRLVDFTLAVTQATNDSGALNAET